MPQPYRSGSHRQLLPTQFPPPCQRPEGRIFRRYCRPPQFKAARASTRTIARICDERHMRRETFMVGNLLTASSMRGAVLLLGSASPAAARMTARRFRSRRVIPLPGVRMIASWC